MELKDQEKVTECTDSILRLINNWQIGEITKNSFYRRIKMEAYKIERVVDKYKKLSERAADGR